jgi:hypothetical protein
MNAYPENSTIVLVHGAWADGSYWTNVILPLQRHGLKVTCAPIPLTSLTDDVAALNRALERTSGPLVVIAAVASKEVELHRVQRSKEPLCSE